MTPGVEVEALNRDFVPRRRARRGAAGDRPRVVRALEDVSLTIPAGEVHGLLGPNGAGKTTLVKIVSTILLPTSGRVRVHGLDVVERTAEVRPLLGIVFGGELGLYTRLTARQNLDYWAALYRLPRRVARRRVPELLDRLGLGERADDPVQTFSRGMKQRLHIARGLVGDPRVLFLDEPTSGMDPIAARECRALIASLRAEGRTMLLATHDLAEAEELCDRVTLIDHGRVLATERPATLATWLERYERVEVAGADPAVLDQVRAMPGVGAITTDADGGARIQIVAADATGPVLARLVAAGVTSITTARPSLEEVYVHVIGNRGLRL